MHAPRQVARAPVTARSSGVGPTKAKCVSRPVPRYENHGCCSSKHSGPAATDTVCEMCVAAHGLDDALPTSEPPRFEPAASHEAPVIAAFVSTGSQARVDPPIRGPPVLAA